MRILVTGAGGMLGGDLVTVFSARHEVIATDVRELDVTLWKTVGSSVAALRPDLVVHLAAMTDVDRCEREPDRAMLVNVVGTESVAAACRKLGVPMMYTSTIAVFDGAKDTPYTEFDTPNPLSVYARSKWLGEQAVRQYVPEHYIVRAGWLFGGADADKKFVGKMLKLASVQSEIRVVTDRFGSPTSTLDFSRAALELVDRAPFGTYHLVNTGPACSRLEYARAVLEAAKLDCRLVPISSVDMPLSAPRPRMEAADDQRLRLLGFEPLRGWPEALAEYVAFVRRKA